MNRVFAIIWIIFISLQLKGQVFPLSDHYGYNMLAINPASAGCDQALSATLLYRRQWVGFKDAPQNQALAVHTPLNYDRMGLGLLMESNNIGIFRQTNLMANYAYRRELYSGKLSLGLGFGVTLYHNSWDDLQANDANDFELINNPVSAALPSFSLGIYYYSKKYYFGISLPRFLTQEQDPNSGKYKIRNDYSQYEYFAAGGYTFDLGDQVSVSPSCLLKYRPATPLQFDYTVQVSYRNRIQAGIGYRTKSVLIGILQCRINDQLKLAYSYDIDAGNLGKYKSGSHEIGLNYIFSYTAKVAGPRNF